MNEEPINCNGEGISLLEFTFLAISLQISLLILLKILLINFNNTRFDLSIIKEIFPYFFDKNFENISNSAAILIAFYYLIATIGILASIILYIKKMKIRFNILFNTKKIFSRLILFIMTLFIFMCWLQGKDAGRIILSHLHNGDIFYHSITLALLYLAIMASLITFFETDKES